MTRLVHSQDGFRRSLQMTTSSLLGFVEGDDIDPFFYGQVCWQASSGRVPYSIFRAREIAGAGGKSILSSFFHELCENSMLAFDFKGAGKVCVFFLDKDVDDILDTLICSEHVIYTKYYDVTNHIYAEGDLVRGLAAAAYLDSEEVRRWMGCAADWRARMARRWLDWVTLCLLSAYLRVSTACHYSRYSCINEDTLGPVVESRLKSAMESIRLAAEMTCPEFDQVYHKHYGLVLGAIESGDQDRFFRGKWYPYLLSESLVSSFPRIADKKALASRLSATVLETYDFAGVCADHFVQPVKALIEKSGLDQV